jgi:hypothetical protein
MSYSIKEKEPTLVCSDQDMLYPYSIKEKEPILVYSDQDMSYSIEQASVGSFSLMLYDIS